MERNIIDTVRFLGSFRRLVEALEIAGLADVLSMSGGLSFTFFAPNDEAFGKLPKEAQRELLTKRDRLREVLRYHMVVGSMKSSDVARFKSAGMLHGRRISMDASGRVNVDDARIIESDIKCSNGIIHVIDSVLMPKRAGREVRPFPA